MEQEHNRILILEEAVAGLLRRVRVLEARISELEECTRRTAPIQEKKDEPVPADKKYIPGKIITRPYTWADLKKPGRPFT